MTITTTVVKDKTHFCAFFCFLALNSALTYVMVIV
jgi:hypothetical protein